MAKPEPLLNLDTLVTRPTVIIDGVEHEMLAPGELSILDLHRFGAMGEDLQALAAQKSADLQLDAAQAAHLSESLDGMVRMILRAPDAVLGRLTAVHKFAIVNSFNGLTLNRRPAAAVSKPPAGEGVAAETPAPSTGEKS